MRLPPGETALPPLRASLVATAATFCLLLLQVDAYFGSAAFSPFDAASDLGASSLLLEYIFSIQVFSPPSPPPSSSLNFPFYMNLVL